MKSPSHTALHCSYHLSFFFCVRCRHGDLSRPQSGPQGRSKSERLWVELTNTLNSHGGGVQKSSDKWKKVDIQ